MKRLVFAVLTVLISISATLLVLEVGLRLLGLQDSFAVTVNTWDKDVGTRQIPGAHGFLIVPQYRMDLKINSKGLRDREFAYEKPQGVRRVLCLGDSFTCGYGVGADETYSKILERGLNEVATHDVRWEVLNAGVGSTGTAHQLAWYDVEGYKYDPDVVVLAFYPKNDYWDSLVSGLYTLEGDRLVKHEAPETSAREIQNLTRWIPGYDTLFARSHLFNYVKYQFAQYHFQHLTDLAQSKAGTSDLHPGENDLTRRLIRALRDESSAHSARLIMMVIPETESQPQSTRTLQLIEYARSLGIACLDLAPIFAPSGGDVTYPGEGHWNSKGHALAASMLQEFLLSEGVTEGPAGAQPGSSTGPPLGRP